MSSTPTGSGTDLLVGVAVRVHGLQGELAVDVHTDSPEERFAVGVVLRGRRPGVPDRALTVESARPHGGRLLVRFVEAPNRTAAEELRGFRLVVDAADLAAPQDPDEFHVHQLEGLRAELADGTVVGTVHEVVHGPAGELLVVRRPDLPGGGVGAGSAEVLVPFVHAIVPTVDLDGGRLVLTPPEGLLDPD